MHMTANTVITIWDLVLCVNRDYVVFVFLDLLWTTADSEVWFGPMIGQAWPSWP